MMTFYEAVLYVIAAIGPMLGVAMLLGAVAAWAVRTLAERRRAKARQVPSRESAPLTSALPSMIAPLPPAPTVRVPLNRVDLTGRTFTLDKDVVRDEYVVVATFAGSVGERALSHRVELVLDPVALVELHRALLVGATGERLSVRWGDDAR